MLKNAVKAAGLILIHVNTGVTVRDFTGRWPATSGDFGVPLIMDFFYRIRPLGAPIFALIVSV
jgi:hypothetical protein